MRILKLTFLLTLITTMASAQYELFWTDQSSATMSGLSTSDPEAKVFHDKEDGIRRLEINTKNRQLFWTNFGSGTLWQSNPNGSNKKATLKLDGNISTFSIDAEKELIYYVMDNESRIMVSDLDGNERREFAMNAGQVQGLDVDLRTGMVYWTDIQSGKVVRVAADGMDTEVILASEDMLFYDLAIDQINDRIYLTDRFNNTINRMDLDGGNFEEILSLDGLAGSICVDGSKELIFFKDGDTIQQAGLEGDNSYTLVKGIKKLSGIAIFSAEENTVANKNN